MVTFTYHFTNLLTNHLVCFDTMEIIRRHRGRLSRNDLQITFYSGKELLGILKKTMSYLNSILPQMLNDSFVSNAYLSHCHCLHCCFAASAVACIIVLVIAGASNFSVNISVSFQYTYLKISLGFCTTSGLL